MIVPPAVFAARRTPDGPLKPIRGGASCHFWHSRGSIVFLPSPNEREDLGASGGPRPGKVGGEGGTSASGFGCLFAWVILWFSFLGLCPGNRGVGTEWPEHLTGPLPLTTGLGAGTGERGERRRADPREALTRGSGTKRRQRRKWHCWSPAAGKHEAAIRIRAPPAFACNPSQE